MAKPKVGIFGLTGCAGDQLVILNCEDELLDLVELIDIRSFIMAASDPDEACELDVAFVEGAVVTAHDAEVLQRARARARLLVALGTCAAWGGVARAEALDKHVKVDAVITGCPIEKHELLDALANLLRGQLPVFPKYAVCVECKARENECLLVGRDVVCAGPLTAAGCHARCPSVGVACVGCRGPAADANFESAMRMFAAKGYDETDIRNRLSTFVVGVA